MTRVAQALVTHLRLLGKYQTKVIGVKECLGNNLLVEMLYVKHPECKSGGHMNPQVNLVVSTLSVTSSLHAWARDSARSLDVFTICCLIDRAMPKDGVD